MVYVREAGGGVVIVRLLLERGEQRWAGVESRVDGGEVGGGPRRGVVELGLGGQGRHHTSKRWGQEASVRNSVEVVPRRANRCESQLVAAARRLPLPTSL